MQRADEIHAGADGGNSVAAPPHPPPDPNNPAAASAPPIPPVLQLPPTQEGNGGAVEPHCTEVPATQPRVYKERLEDQPANSLDKGAGMEVDSQCKFGVRRKMIDAESTLEDLLALGDDGAEA